MKGIYQWIELRWIRMIRSITWWLWNISAFHCGQSKPDQVKPSDNWENWVTLSWCGVEHNIYIYICIVYCKLTKLLLCPSSITDSLNCRSCLLPTTVSLPLLPLSSFDFRSPWCPHRIDDLFCVLLSGWSPMQAPLEVGLIFALAGQRFGFAVVYWGAV